MSLTVLLTGATGMVGAQVLAVLLEAPDVSAVISVGRRQVGLEHPKLRDLTHADFLDFSPLSAEFRDVDICFHCLGVYRDQVPKDAFFRLTCDVQKALTDALARANPAATFVLFSAQGADPTEKSPMVFARAKGRAERMLEEAGFERFYIFRPGYIHPTGVRRPRGLLYRLTIPVANLLRRLSWTIGITDRELAAAMVKTGLSATRPSGIVEMAEIRGI